MSQTAKILKPSNEYLFNYFRTEWTNSLHITNLGAHTLGHIRGLFPVVAVYIRLLRLFNEGVTVIFLIYFVLVIFKTVAAFLTNYFQDVRLLYMLYIQDVVYKVCSICTVVIFKGW